MKKVFLIAFLEANQTGILANATFLRLANKIENIGLSKLRLYFQGDNLVTLQSHKGIDPEQSLAGTTNNRSFNQRIFSLGINLEF